MDHCVCAPSCVLGTMPRTVAGRVPVKLEWEDARDWKQRAIAAMPHGCVACHWPSAHRAEAIRADDALCRQGRQRPKHASEEMEGETIY